MTSKPKVTSGLRASPSLGVRGVAGEEEGAFRRATSAANWAATLLVSLAGWAGGGGEGEGLGGEGIPAMLKPRPDWSGGFPPSFAPSAKEITAFTSR